MIKKYKSGGFTIVELLIVIVIIGILAAIVIVAYNGITTKAQVAAITSEAKAWEKLFEAYKATNGSYPLPAASPIDGGGGPSNALTATKSRYCLGTGFPKVSGIGTCYSQTANSPYNVYESTGASIISQLATVGTVPTNTKKYVIGDVIGPHLRYISATEMWIVTTYPPGDCPSGMISEWTDNTTRNDCYIKLSS